QRPSLQCRNERVAQRVFRAGDIARARRNISDKLAIRIARNGLNCSMRRRFAHGLKPNSLLKRSSLVLVVVPTSQGLRRGEPSVFRGAPKRSDGGLRPRENLTVSGRRN